MRMTSRELKALPRRSREAKTPTPTAAHAATLAAEAYRTCMRVLEQIWGRHHPAHRQVHAQHEQALALSRPPVH